ncbi:FAD-binding oxidoreductase [Paracoccus sp. Z118]|uniref:NAD(P)/FAD-dependent oxidoreductase n=1 Tax=Paracoccus sp. Z118 TaxID=2851017 RepID=UPI001C2C2913|nr:FAD-binding oxidoreductase [Paracoccus sp. Z118]MBV0892662.1 FAD-binding oxidoreductase [Paracoccus sp. Z118]
MVNAPIADKTTPYWWEEAPPVAIPEHPLPKSPDVAIVGAGYAGLTAGIVLARAGKSVVCIDKMNPGEGASTRNGGITSGNIRPGRQELIRRFGQDRADAIEREGRAAREWTYDFIRTENMDCDFQLVGRYAGALGKEQYESMAREADALARRLGVESYAVPQSEQLNYLGSDYYRGGTVRMDTGGLHPAKYHRELMRVAKEAGVGIHSGVHVDGVAREGSGFVVRTDKGAIKAGQVLVCTNGYTDASDRWLRRRLVPVRSRIITTEELPADLMARLMPRGMMLSENRKVGFYYRPSPDRRRILLGGRDASIHGEPVGPALHLREGLVRLFPELKDVRLSHTWHGNVAMNRDMLPRIFEKDGVHYATGFCGSGVVWAPWIGSRAAYKLLGDRERGVSAFDFRPPAAVPFYSGTPWFMPAMIQAFRLQDVMALRRQTR